MLERFDKIRQEYRDKGTILVNYDAWHWVISSLDLAYQALDAVESDICGYRVNSIMHATYAKVTKTLALIRGGQ